jgi:hypothetical protein
MAKFIEYKSNPWWTGLYMACGAVVIPPLACILFIREVISTTGFVVIIACGMGGLFLLIEQVERRTRKVIEVASGKLPKQLSRTVDHAVREFREDAVYPTMLLVWSIIVLLLLLLLGFLPTVYRTKGAWAAVGVVLPVSPAVLLLAMSWGSLVRLRIEGDEVQVVHPFLGGWGNRAFRFGEIASVEVRVVYEFFNEGKQVRIGLHDGSSVRYRTWDETKADELVGALKRGVAEAKPAKVDWSELA